MTREYRAGLWGFRVLFLVLPMLIAQLLLWARGGDPASTYAMCFAGAYITLVLRAIK